MSFRWIAALTLCAAACGTTSPTSPDAASDAASDAGNAACADLAAARCQKRDMCTGGLGNERQYGDLTTCKARDVLGCEAALGAPGTSATPAFYESCSQAIGGESCGDWFGNAPPAACVPAPGARANGQACSFNAQCASTWCAVPKGAACGACAALPKVGDACDTTADCGRGLLCAPANTCATPVQASGTCDSSRPCAAGLTCVGETKTAPGACMAAGATAGAACDPKHQTAAGCDGNLGLACIGTTCAKIQLVGAGAPCGALTDAGTVEDVAACTGGALCVMPQGSKSGNCVAPAADGAACDATNGPPCLAPARCVTASDASTAGVCTLPSSNACN